MNVMNTYSGRKFDPMKIAPEDVYLEDIAHALSLVCRGGGQIRWFYSVGQHSINCAHEALARGWSDRMALACLLHDASECYISDVIRPVKVHLQNYLEIESMIMDAIWEKFHLDDLTDEENQKWKQIDNEILELELKTLMKGEKAEKLGMTGTHFSSISGLHREDHYSTAKDIALLLRYAIKNDTFREIIESPYHSTSGTNIHPDGITFYSTMFKNLSDTSVIDGEIKGGKTGYTSQAGHCLASFAEIDGVEYILVTAGAPGTGNPHIDDAVKLYNRLGESSSVLYGK